MADNGCLRDKECSWLSTLTHVENGLADDKDGENHIQNQLRNNDRETEFHRSLIRAFVMVLNYSVPFKLLKSLCLL